MFAETEKEKEGEGEGEGEKEGEREEGSQETEKSGRELFSEMIVLLTRHWRGFSSIGPLPPIFNTSDSDQRKRNKKTIKKNKCHYTEAEGEFLESSCFHYLRYWLSFLMDVSRYFSTERKLFLSHLLEEKDILALIWELISEVLEYLFDWLCPILGDADDKEDSVSTSSTSPPSTTPKRRPFAQYDALNQIHSLALKCLYVAYNFSMSTPVRVECTSTPLVNILRMYITAGEEFDFLKRKGEKRGGGGGGGGSGGGFGNGHPLSHQAAWTLAHLSTSIPRNQQIEILNTLTGIIEDGLRTLSQIALGISKTKMAMSSPLSLLSTLCNSDTNQKAAFEAGVIELSVDLIQGTQKSKRLQSLVKQYPNRWKNVFSSLSTPQWFSCLRLMCKICWSLSFELQYRCYMDDRINICEVFCKLWENVLTRLSKAEASCHPSGEEGGDGEGDDEEARLDYLIFHEYARKLLKTITRLFWQMGHQYKAKNLKLPPISFRRSSIRSSTPTLLTPRIGRIPSILLSSHQSPSSSFRHQHQHQQQQIDKLVNEKEEKEIEAPWVMISYSWGNQDSVLQFRKELKKRGVNVWIDVEQMGGSTVEAMANAVEKSGIVILCMSRIYQESRNCRSEAEYAYQCKKHVVCLKMEKFAPTGWLGFLLGTKLYYEMFPEGGCGDFVEKIVKEIQKHGPSCISSPSSSSSSFSTSNPVSQQAPSRSVPLSSSFPSGTPHSSEVPPLSISSPLPLHSSEPPQKKADEKHHILQLPHSPQQQPIIQQASEQEHSIPPQDCHTFQQQLPQHQHSPQYFSKQQPAQQFSLLSSPPSFPVSPLPLGPGSGGLKLPQEVLQWNQQQVQCWLARHQISSNPFLSSLDGLGLQVSQKIYLFSFFKNLIILIREFVVLFEPTHLPLFLFWEGLWLIQFVLWGLLTFSVIILKQDEKVDFLNNLRIKNFGLPKSLHGDLTAGIHPPVRKKFDKPGLIFIAIVLIGNKILDFTRRGRAHLVVNANLLSKTQKPPSRRR